MVVMSIRGFHRGLGRTASVVAAPLEDLDESGLPELDADDLVRLTPLFASDDEASRHYPKLSAEEMAFAAAHLAESKRFIPSKR
jgi:hypothetical protein